MKLNKMISTFCAACMLLTALSATYALDNADPISEYAGQSVVCQVFTEADGELTSRLVTVSIPAGATQSEEATLLITTAYGPQTRSTRETLDISTVAQTVIFTTADVPVSNGNDISVNARTNMGTAHTTVCTVQGSTF